MAYDNETRAARRRERYHTDPEFRERALTRAKRYHADKRANDPEYVERRSKYNKANAEYFNEKAKEYNSARPFHYAFRRLRMRAKQNGLLFDLDEQYLIDIWTGVCAIFGTPLQLPYSTERQVPDKATIDKIDPALGYVRGNVQWVSNRANTIKSFGTIEEHQLIVDYMKKHLL